MVLSFVGATAEPHFVDRTCKPDLAVIVINVVKDSFVISYGALPPTDISANLPLMN